MSNPTTIRMDEGLDALIRGAASGSKQTDEIPELSQAEIIRLLMWESADELLEGDLSEQSLEEESIEIHPEQLEELIPDHKLAKFYRERRKDQGWYTDMKEGFKGRVRDKLGQRFKRGYSPEGIRQRAESFAAEARDYWLLIEDDPERAEEMVNYVWETVADLEEQHEILDWDPHQSWLDNISESVGGGPEVVAHLSWRVISDARDRIQRAEESHVVTTSEETQGDIARAVSKQHQIPEEAAQVAVEIANREQPQIIAEDAAESGGVATDD